MWCMHIISLVETNFNRQLNFHQSHKINWFLHSILFLMEVHENPFYLANLEYNMIFSIWLLLIHSNPIQPHLCLSSISFFSLIVNIRLREKHLRLMYKCKRLMKRNEIRLMVKCYVMFMFNAENVLSIREFSVTHTYTQAPIIEEISVIVSSLNMNFWLHFSKKKNIWMAETSNGYLICSDNGLNCDLKDC